MRILLAEDEKELSAALTMILEHNCYSVDPVYNGRDALDYARSGQYDCLILDIMMPGMDGLRVLEQLRLAKNDVPVLLLTARSDYRDRISGLDAGADDYLTKPFDMGELLARIRAITRRRGSNVTNRLSFGDMSLDREQFVLTGPAESLRLGKKEYQMMELLLENPNRVISTELFLTKIWGYDTDTDVSGVWVYLSSLRKKLQKIGSSVEIRANRGIGYTLMMGEGGTGK